MERGRFKYSELIFPVFAFFLLIAVATFPLIFNFGQAIPGFRSTDESYAVLHYFWWLKYALLHHLPAAWESIRAYPFGVEYSIETIHHPWLSLTSLFSLLTNEVAAYNLVVFLNLVMAGIAMYLLVYYMLRNRTYAFFAGLVYALCPYQFSRAWQHFILTFTQWMPLYILGLLKIYEAPRRKFILASALCFFIIVSIEFHYALFMMVATAVFFIYALIHASPGSRKPLLKASVLLLALLFIFSIVTALPLIKTMLSSPGAATPSAWGAIRPFDDLFSQSARPLSYFLPPITHPFFGGFTQFFIGTRLYGESLTEHALYLGWAAMILAFIALKKWMKGLRAVPKQSDAKEGAGGDNFYIGFFALLAFAAWICSQPPWWNILGFKLYMPSFIFYKIVPTMRAYCRFGILVMLAVAVLAAFGLRYLLQNKKRPFAAILYLIFLLFAGFEFLNFPPFKIIKLNQIPEVYLWCKTLPETTVIAEYPLDIEGPDPLYLFYQTKHAKPIINGAIPGTKGHAVLSKMRDLSDPQTTAWLGRAGVRYILVHINRYRDSEDASDRQELERIHSAKQLRMVENFGETEVFEIIREGKN